MERLSGSQSPTSWSQLLGEPVVHTIQKILEAAPHSVDSLLKELTERGHAPMRRSVRTFLEEAAENGLLRRYGSDTWAMPPRLAGEAAKSHPLLRYRDVSQRSAILDFLGDGSRSFSESEIVRGVLVGGIPADPNHFRITVYQVMREMESNKMVRRDGGRWWAIGDGEPTREPESGDDG